jgi:hypothetical protein
LIGSGVAFSFGEIGGLVDPQSSFEEDETTPADSHASGLTSSEAKRKEGKEYCSKI